MNIETNQEKTLPDDIRVPRRHYFFAWLFFTFWLVPILLVGLMNRGIPFYKLTRIGVPQHLAKQTSNYMNNLYRVACLFPNRMEAWGEYYFQIQLNHSGVWIEVPETHFAQMKPFGFRTRFKRMFSGINHEPNKNVRLDALSDYIKRRYEEQFPRHGTVTGVRILSAVLPTGQPEMCRPQGHWEKPELEMLSIKQVHVLHSKSYSGASL
ncbi:MAG: hypothetical protein KC713_04610 [Candidatus Omnitrophica bacterium]|nr:hypothetical protein [Candidatus Omnitrophota bacterium]